MKSKFIIASFVTIVTCFFVSCNENRMGGSEVDDGQIKIAGSYWTGDGDFRSISFRNNGDLDLNFSDSNTKYQWSARNGRYSVFTENNKTKIDVNFEASFYPYGATSPSWVTFHGIQTVLGDKDRGFTMTFVVSGTLPSNYGSQTFVSSMKKN